MSSALGRLVAAVALDTAEFTAGTEKAKYQAAAMATSVDKTLKDLERGANTTVRNIAASFAAGFGVSALIGLAENAFNSMVALDNLSRQAGISAASLSKFDQPARQSGVALDTVSSAIYRLSQAAQQANDPSTKAAVALNAIGLSAKDLKGLAPDQMFILVAQALDKFSDGAAKNVVIQDLLSKSGREMAGVLKSVAEAGTLTATVTDDQIAAAKKYEDQIITLKMSSDKLWRGLVTDALPGLTNITKAMKEAYDQSGLLMAAWVGLGGAAAEALSLNSSDEQKIKKSIQSIENQILQAKETIEKGPISLGDGIFDRSKVVAARLELEKLNASLRQYEETLTAMKGGYDDQVSRAARAGQVLPGAKPPPNLPDASAFAQTLKASNDLNNVLSSIDEKAAGFSTNWSKDMAILSEGFATGQIGAAKYAETVGKLVAQQPAVQKAWETQAASAKAYTDQLIAAAQAETDAITALDELTNSLQDQATSLDAEIKTMGMSEGDRQKYILDLRTELELKRLLADPSLSDDDAAKKRDEVLTEKDKVKALIDQKQVLTQQTAVWSQLGDVVGNFFGDLALNGSKAFTDLKNQLRSFAAEVIAFFAKRFLLQMVTGVAGSVGASGVQAAGNSALNGMSNSLMGTAMTGLNEYGGSLIGASTLTGGVSSAVFGTGALTGAGDFVGTGLAGLAGNMALAAGATDAMAASIAAVVPVIGWIIAAAAILYAIFGSKGGAPKSGGSFMGNFDPSGALTGSTLAPGDANGRFFTPNGADSQMQAATKGVAAAYYGTLASLGGKAPGSVGFGLGFDTDPGGTADNRISSAVSVNGNTVFLSKDRGIGRDQNQIAPEMQLEASRMILSALQSSELPQYIANVFKGVDALTADQTTINNLLQTAGALKTIFDVTQHDPLADLAQGMTDALNPLAAALRNNKAAIEGAMKAWDGSLATTQNLQQATVSYYNAQLQLMAGIEQTKQSIDAMFGNTVRNFKLAGMDSQGKYNYYQQDAASLQQQILASSDPSTIQALSQKLDQDMEAAFNLLTPEQQAGPEGQAFISRAESTDKAIGDHLDAIKKDLVDATKEMLTEIKDAIGASDATQTAAASTNLDAAHITLTAAQTPRQLILTINGEQQVVSFGG